MKEFIYSRNAVYETLRAQRRQGFQLLLADGIQEKGRLAEIIHLARKFKIHTRRVPRIQLDKIHPQHQGVALETGGYIYQELPDIFELADQCGESPFILLLDTLQDPQNLGTLLRTAEAVGVHGVVIPLARTAEITPAVVNTSSGASEHLIIVRANLARTIAALKKTDTWVVGLEGSLSAKFPSQVRLDGALALVVGSEGKGMRSLVRDSCDVLLRLPMRGEISSLNAAVAGSIALYLILQERGFSE